MEEFTDNFFHLMEKIYYKGATEELRALGDKFLIIKPSKGLKFPARDVSQIITKDDEINIECQFMGLYGVDSPLPPYLNELCLKQDGTGQKLRDFLDVFNHRNYTLYFHAWRAFQPECNINEQGNYLKFINSFAGYQACSSRFSWLEFLAKDNDAGLKAAISQIIPEVSVHITTNHLIWQAVEGVGHLGDGFQLANNSLLGHNMLTRSHCLLLELGPMSPEMAKSLLPGTEKALAINTLLRSSLPITMQFKIKITVLTNEYNLTLGQADAFFGCLTWLGKNGSRQYSYYLS